MFRTPSVVIRLALQISSATLYAIGCNMFHGHKGFEPIQLELLKPAILLLKSTINVLYRALD